MINSSGENLFLVKIETAVLHASSLIANVATIADRRRWVSACSCWSRRSWRSWRSSPSTVLTGSAAPSSPTPSWWPRSSGRSPREHPARRREQIRAWTVLDADWPAGGDEVTQTLKLRRSRIDEKHAAEIEATYG